MPASDHRDPALGELASWLPEKRAVPEQPNPFGRCLCKLAPHGGIIVFVREVDRPRAWSCIHNYPRNAGHELCGEFHFALCCRHCRGTTLQSYPSNRNNSNILCQAPHICRDSRYGLLGDDLPDGFAGDVELAARSSIDSLPQDRQSTLTTFSETPISRSELAPQCPHTNSTRASHVPGLAAPIAAWPSRQSKPDRLTKKSPVGEGGANVALGVGTGIGGYPPRRQIRFLIAIAVKWQRKAPPAPAGSLSAEGLSKCCDDRRT
jgi:hypothetical protein